MRSTTYAKSLLQTKEVRFYNHCFRHPKNRLEKTYLAAACRGKVFDTGDKVHVDKNVPVVDS